jgi:preprotein translocase subunit SecA
MFNWIIRKIVGSQNERQVKKMRPLVAKINQIEASLQALPDEALRQKNGGVEGRAVANQG